MKILYKVGKLVKTSFVEYDFSPSSELSAQTLGIMIGVELAKIGVMYDSAVGVTNDGSRPTYLDTSNDSESRLGTASIEFEAGLLNKKGMGGRSVDMDLPVIMLLTLKSE